MLYGLDTTIFYNNKITSHIILEQYFSSKIVLIFIIVFPIILVRDLVLEFEKEWQSCINKNKYIHLHWNIRIR
jgi:hypothetical protein